MSTMFWKVLKLSPALLGASLLVASGTYAREKVPDQTVAFSKVQAATVETAVDPSAELPQTTAVASNTEAAPVAEQTVALSKAQAAETVELAVEPLAGLPQTQVEDTSVSLAKPSNASPNLNQTDSILAQQVPAAGNTEGNPSELLQQINRYSEDNSLDQVTNVGQLTDVSPGDWAYEALRSLVERYGCIVGYPDGTFRGNRATTRFEFAAGLNACLNQVERLIATATEGFVRREDLETLQRLVQEFQSELTALRGRVDTLESRVAQVEENQFSTTTKLSGEVIFAIADTFGDQATSGVTAGRSPDYDDNTVFFNRVRLNFDTSFTGKDRLRTRLQAGNFNEFDFNSSGGDLNVTREGRLGFTTGGGNNIALDDLYYRFPLSNVATAHIFAYSTEFNDFVPVLNPGFDPSGTGAISRFGRFNPIYRIGQPAQSAGAGLTIGPSSPIRIDVGYLSGITSANDPGEDAGFLNGSYSALGQVTFQPTPGFSLAATYIHSYSTNPDSTSGTGALGGGLGHGTGSIASQVNNTFFPVVSNSYGIQASFAFSPQLVLSGWAGLTEAIVVGTGDVDVWNYGATLAINDFGTKGSTLGFVVGMEPKVTGTSNPLVANRIGLDTRREDADTGLHVEGFYKFRLSPNVLITPGLIWLTAPGHNDNNDDIIIGTVRTTFTF